MYEKCVECDRLGKDCIPNLYVMSADEIRDFARKLKDKNGWSNAELASVSGVPKGTIDYNFSKRSGKSQDVSYSTFQPVLCALIGCEATEMPCRKQTKEYYEMKSQVSTLMIENYSLHAQIEDFEKRNEEAKSEYEERIDYFKEQLKWRKQMLILGVSIICVLMSVIILSVVIDWFDWNVGYFWRY